MEVAFITERGGKLLYAVVEATLDSIDVRALTYLAGVPVRRSDVTTVTRPSGTCIIAYVRSKGRQLLWLPYEKAVKTPIGDFI